MAISAMYAAATGMKALDTKLNVVANNLANVNTVGFKRSRVNFEDLMYQVRREPGVRDANDEPNPHGIQVGLGVQESGTQLNFQLGTIDPSDRPLDIAIEGEGFLQVRTFFNGQERTAYTRAGNLVRNASNHNGPYPRVSIWQGTNDTTVNPTDQTELVDQWTNVLGIDQTPDTEDTINGHEHKLYKNDNGEPLIETFLINGMGHGTPVDPGDADDQCGEAAAYILDVGTCSSYYIIKFWGLDSQ